MATGLSIYRAFWVMLALVGLTLWLPSPAVGQSAVEQWRPAVEASCGGDASCVNWMMITIACESVGDPNALGAHGEVGLLQIKPFIWTSVDVWDPYASIAFAVDMYASGQGYHWECAPW